jgi:hypothetical protein
MAAKIAIVHRQRLATVIRRRNPRSVLYAAVLGLIVANTVNARVDSGVIAAAINLVVPVLTWLLYLPVALLLLALLVFGDFDLIQNLFKWLTLALLAYIADSFLARPSLVGKLVSTFVTRLSFSGAFLALLDATLGGNVSPYLFYWQADLEWRIPRRAPDKLKTGRETERAPTGARAGTRTPVSSSPPSLGPSPARSRSSAVVFGWPSGLNTKLAAPSASMRCWQPSWAWPARSSSGRRSPRCCPLRRGTLAADRRNKPDGECRRDESCPYGSIVQ